MSQQAEQTGIQRAAAQLAQQLKSSYPDQLVHCAHAWWPRGTELADGTDDVILVLFNTATGYFDTSFDGYPVVIETS